MFGAMPFEIGFGVIGIIFTIFSIAMLVNVIKRKFKDNTEKVIWVLAIIFTNCVGALLYYFLVYRKDKKSDPRLLIKIIMIAFGILLLSLIAILAIFLINHIV